MSSSVCISGIGIVSPLGASRDSFRDALLACASGIRPLVGIELTDARSHLGAQVSDFDATRWIPPMKLRRMDEAARFALVAVRQAFDDALFPIADAGEDDAGVVLGTFSAGGSATADFLQAFWTLGPTGAPALLFNSTVANAAASAAGLELKLRGPNTTLSQKEASGIAAIGTAVDFVRDGRARVLAAGGVDAIYAPFFRAHDWFGVFAREKVRPLDAGRSGFVLGEGAYVLLLERTEDPPARGVRPYGTILGIGAAADPTPTNAWPVCGDGIRRTIRLALQDAQLEPEDVDVVFAAANGAPALDEVEAGVLSEVFGDRPVVTTIKGAIGECGAASAAAVAAACLCGRIGRIPGVTGLQTPAAAASGLRLARGAMDLPGPIVLVNAIASGGALSAMVLRLDE